MRASEAPAGICRAMRGACKGSKAQRGHCPLSFSAHNRPYLMTMAAEASKKGIILGRLWAALLLNRFKRLRGKKKKKPPQRGGDKNLVRRSFRQLLASRGPLELTKRSAVQRRSRMIPCLQPAAAMVMRYGRLCTENRSGHVHYVPTSPYHAPRMVLRTPTGAPDAPWDTISNV